MIKDKPPTKPDDCCCGFLIGVLITLLVVFFLSLDTNTKIIYSRPENRICDISNYSLAICNPNPGWIYPSYLPVFVYGDAALFVSSFIITCIIIIHGLFILFDNYNPLELAGWYAIYVLIELIISLFSMIQSIAINITFFNVNFLLVTVPYVLIVITIKGYFREDKTVVVPEKDVES